MKYIVMGVESKEDFKLEIPVIFPDLIVHSEMARVVDRLLRDQFIGAHVIPISAGFLSSADCNANCYGESESLKIKSREAIDTRLICYADYGSTNA